MPERSRRPIRLAPRHKVWVLCDGLFLMGPNYLRFLRAVDQTGTIREAGKAVGWSYRTCLNRVRHPRLRHDPAFSHLRPRPLPAMSTAERTPRFAISAP